MGETEPGLREDIPPSEWGLGAWRQPHHDLEPGGGAPSLPSHLSPSLSLSVYLSVCVCVHVHARVYVCLSPKLLNCLSLFFQLSHLIIPLFFSQTLPRSQMKVTVSSDPVCLGLA